MGEPVLHRDDASLGKAERGAVIHATDPLRVKSRLVSLLATHFAENETPRDVAARRLRLSQRKLSNILYGHYEAVSEGQLLLMLIRVGFDVHLRILPTERCEGMFLLHAEDEGVDEVGVAPPSAPTNRLRERDQATNEISTEPPSGV